MWELIHHLLGSMHLLKSVDFFSYCHYFVTFQTSLWWVKGDYSSPPPPPFFPSISPLLIMLRGSSPVSMWAKWNYVLDCFRNSCLIVLLFLASLLFEDLRNQNKNQILSINDWNREREKCIPMEHRCDGRSSMIQIPIKILLEPLLCICIYS